MPLARKKVIVRKWTGEWSPGYLTPPAFTDPGRIALLALDGKVTAVPANEVKWICFVRDFTGGEPNQPDHLFQKAFVRRPRSPGIWFRLRLQDNDVIEGLAQNDISLLDGGGLSFSPPDARSNTQRIMVPRLGIREMEILAVIHSARTKLPSASVQPSLFLQTAQKTTN